MFKEQQQAENGTAKAVPTSAADLEARIHEWGAAFAQRDAEHDRDDTFVVQNYDDLKKLRLFAAAIPQELGGGDLSHAEMANLLRVLAQYSSSTALAHSMHQHLVAANVWKYKKGKGGEPILRKVVAEQPILISTGAKDWLESNGTMEKVAGGYLVSAQKYFSSQAAVGDIAVTSAPYQDPNNGWQVLHFGVPMNAEGVSLIENWQTLGMRGTGSHTIQFEKVFVPDSAITLARPRGEYHPIWNIVLGVAMPYIMAVYVGIAQKASEIALTQAKKWAEPRPYLASAIGQMNNALVTAVTVWEDMLRLSNNYHFEPVDQLGQDILTRKTIVANATIEVVTQAMDIVGGAGYYRSYGLEKLFRDVQAAKHHPLPEKEQLLYSGEYLLKG
jgi:alkylation response protein AidB-like acyl-CoA dehydrogenase